MKGYKFSKFITTFLVLSIVACGWLWKETMTEIERNFELFPETAAERAERLKKNQTEEAFSNSYYSRIRFVNTEKGYYAVLNRDYPGKEPSYFHIVNCEEQMVKDLSEYKIRDIYDTVGGLYSIGYVMGRDEEREHWYMIDRETLEVYPVGGSLIEVHPQTGYYLQEVGTGEKGYQIRSPEGEILLRSEDRIQMTSDPGYIIRLKDDRSQLIDMASGTVLFECGGPEVIEDLAHGFTVINGTAPGKDRDSDSGVMECRYVLDGEFQPALNGRIFSSVSVNEDYIYGNGWIDGYLEGENNRTVVNDQWNYTAVVYTHDGQLIYEGQQMDQAEGLDDKTLAVGRFIERKGGRNFICVYVNLAEGGAKS